MKKMLSNEVTIIIIFMLIVVLDIAIRYIIHPSMSANQLIVIGGIAIGLLRFMDGILNRQLESEDDNTL